MAAPECREYVFFFQEGYTKVDIALALGASRQNVSRWCKLYEEGGMEALELGRRGRRPMGQAKLTWIQCGSIVRIIQDKIPDGCDLYWM
ncbi:MAG: transposase [Verrucomicrobiales bacterium]|jgi:transposase